jgi:hypothetical protein
MKFSIPDGVAGKSGDETALSNSQALLLVASKFLALNGTDLDVVESGYPICRNLPSLLFAYGL